MIGAPEQASAPATVQRRPIREIVAYFLRLGTIGFGGQVSNPLLVGAAAAIGLIAFPLLQPAWVMVK
jgi:hypothetical protein